MFGPEARAGGVAGGEPGIPETAGAPAGAGRPPARLPPARHSPASPVPSGQ